MLNVKKGVPIQLFPQLRVHLSSSLLRKRNSFAEDMRQLNSNARHLNNFIKSIQTENVSMICLPIPVQIETVHNNGLII